MRFLVDAQLPRALAEFLAQSGHDAIHTLELPRGNRSTDTEIADRADAEDRIVLSKDSDFRDRHLASHTPRRVLLVETGNIANDELLGLVATHLGSIEHAFAEADYVELRDTLLVIHTREPSQPKPGR